MSMCISFNTLIRLKQISGDKFATDYNEGSEREREK